MLRTRNFAAALLLRSQIPFRSSQEHCAALGVLRAGRVGTRLRLLPSTQLPKCQEALDALVDLGPNF